tara:strand:+ start:461 stop:952 length:492 start_codon:yes stop_codon:yes gene_type:complete
MLPLTYVHLILVLFHIAAFARMWYVWKKNQLDRQMNVMVRDGLGKLAVDMQAQITENEKLVAKARLQVKEAMAKLNGGPSIPADAVPFHDDAPMLASILTAIVVKQGGDIRLSLSDMSLAEGNDYVSIYIDAEKQEMIFSTDHTKHLDMSLVNFSSSDDETYH